MANCANVHFVQMRMRLPSLVLLAALLSLGGCDAPRDNPYDPGAGNYFGPGVGTGSLAGQVTGLAGQHLSGAVVLATSSAGAIQGDASNAQGSYLILDVPAGVYQLVCTLPGYAPDSASAIVLVAQQTGGVDFRLDALPAVPYFVVTSHYYHQEIIPPLYYSINAQARISEPDGRNDLDTVALEIEGGSQYALSYDSTSSPFFCYHLDLGEESLPGQSVDSIMGKTFGCFVSDTSGNWAISNPDFIRRYFVDYPVPLSPNDNEAVFVWMPPLVWDPFNASFPFSYAARVYRDYGSSHPLVWEQSSISPTETSVVVDSLDNGNYFWTLEVTDEYGNSAQSLQAAFIVNHP